MTDSDHPAQLTDADLSHALMDQVGHDFLFSAMQSGGAWYRWVGTHWDVVGAQSELDVLVRRFCEEIAEQRDLKGRERKWILGAQRANSVRSYSESREGSLILESDWEIARADHFINVADGILDATTGELFAHDRSALFRGVSSAAWKGRLDENLVNIWARVCEKCFGSAVKSDLVAEFFGYALTPSMRNHKILFIVGEPGCGKSTIIGAIERVLGSLAVKIGPEILGTRATAKDKAEAMSDLKGKSLALAMEIESGVQLDKSILNRISGGDMLKARVMYVGYGSFSSTSKICIAGNHVADFGDVAGDGMLRRAMVVQCGAALPEAERDTGLPTLFVTPAMQTVILHWLVAGLNRFMARGWVYEEVAEVRTATADALGAGDMVGQFLDEECEIDADLEISRCVTKDELVQRYTQWCDKSVISARYRLSGPGLARAMKKRGFADAKLREGGVRRRVWRGVALYYF